MLKLSVLPVPWVPLPFYLCQSWPVWPFRTNKNGKQALKQLLSFAELFSFVKWWHCSAQSDLSSANRMACDSKSPPKAFLLLFTVHLLGAWRVVRLRFVTKLSQGHLLSSNWSLAIKITRPASSPTIKSQRGITTQAAIEGLEQTNVKDQIS